MSERERNFNDLTSSEFEAMMANVMSPDFHDLTEEDFFAALAAIDEEPAETLELMAAVRNGQLTFLEPAPLRAHGNEILIGDKRVIIKILPEDASSAA